MYCTVLYWLKSVMQIYPPCSLVIRFICVHPVGNINLTYPHTKYLIRCLKILVLYTVSKVCHCLAGKVNHLFIHSNILHVLSYYGIGQNSTAVCNRELEQAGFLTVLQLNVDWPIIFAADKRIQLKFLLTLFQIFTAIIGTGWNILWRF